MAATTAGLGPPRCASKSGYGPSVMARRRSALSSGGTVGKLMQIQAQVIGLEQVQQAMRDAPDLSFRYCKQELGKAGARFKKRFVAERLSGRPGINWADAKRAGGGMKAEVTGTDL